jgi:CheY-like chemotaxis protein
MNNTDLSSMLKLEAIYDVVVAKDGQEAYEMVKASMNEDKFFDLIFMDIQVSRLHFCDPLPRLICEDAESGRVTKYPVDPPNGILGTNCSVDGVC